MNINRKSEYKDKAYRYMYFINHSKQKDSFPSWLMKFCAQTPRIGVCYFEESHHFFNKNNYL